jgi:hypothetical protein
MTASYCAESENTSPAVGTQNTLSVLDIGLPLTLSYIFEPGSLDREESLRRMTANRMERRRR